MIDPVTRWCKTTQYNDKRAISIAHLVITTGLSRYPRPMEFTYGQMSEFIANYFRKPLNEREYRITAKRSTIGNPTYNAILEQINQVLLNIVRSCNIT